MRNISLCLTCLLLCISLNAQKYNGVVDKTVATSGGEVILLSDVEAEVQQMRAGGSSSDEGQSGTNWGHNKNGAYFDGVWYEGDFSYLEHSAGFREYSTYIMGLTPGQRYLLFTSNKREWRMRRWQMQYNLTQADYNDLYERCKAAL